MSILSGFGPSTRLPVGANRTPGMLNTRKQTFDDNLRTRATTLFLGSGNFSLPLSYARKHLDEDRSFGKSMIVTEFKSREECLSPETWGNIESLRALGATVRFNVDGTQIDKTFKGYDNITRIQWDCPDVDEGVCSSSNRLPDTIFATAQAAARLLKEGGTLHFTVLAPSDTWKMRQAVHYQLPRIEDAGFYLNMGTLVESGPGRYDYTHKKTKGKEAVGAAAEGLMSEAIFVRHDTQRTPARYLRSFLGYQVEYLPGGETRDGPQTPFPYYFKPPKPPESPTIQPPSFFDSDRTQRVKTQKRFRAVLDPIDELSLEIEDSVGDIKGRPYLSSKARRMAFRQVCRKAI